MKLKLLNEPWKISAAQITGRQLLEKLKAIPDTMLDIPVAVEGCDCIGPCNGIEVSVAPAGRVALLVTRAMLTDEEQVLELAIMEAAITGPQVADDPPPADTVS